MLRQAQHERKILNDFSTKPVRPEPVEGRMHVFSPHFKKETYIRRHFGSVLVRTGRIEKEWATILAKEQDRRIAADYDAALSMDAESALQLVEEADRFVDRIRRYLVEAQVLGTEDENNG